MRETNGRKFGFRFRWDRLLGVGGTFLVAALVFPFVQEPDGTVGTPGNVVMFLVMVGVPTLFVVAFTLYRRGRPKR